MMKLIRIFQHLDCEGPAYFETILQARNVPYEIIRIDQGANVPAELDDVAGLIFMGGPMSVNDPLDWIDDEIVLIKQAIKQQIPILGVCLGSQLMAKAMGAKVYPGEAGCMEIGWSDIDCVTHTVWTEDLPQTMTVFHWHGETFDLPTGAVRLFSNARYVNQGFALGPHLALQFHVEMLEATIHEWLQRNPGDVARRCDAEHDAQAIIDLIPTHLKSLQHYATTLFAHWLRRCTSA